MISTQQAQAKVFRLSGTRDFPQRAEGIKELVDTLQRESRDDAHAKRIIDAWLLENRFAPTPADLRALALQTDRERIPRYWECGTCHGTGWMKVFELHTWNDGTHKSVERISIAQFEQLKGTVSGIVGDQVALAPVTYCGACSRGRNRRAAAEAERSEAA